ncbi:MAG: hypothetical protein MZV63_65425 [Marinilabiliales bacterium]|nr:hypothetical protein [Marinilabiliales bacterium]
MRREYYSDTISEFLRSSKEEIVGKLALGSDFPDTLEQRAAWVEEIRILQGVLHPYSGRHPLRVLDPENGRADRCSLGHRSRHFRPGIQNRS